MNDIDPARQDAQQTIVVVTSQKSVAVAFILAFFFGPLGLLYATVTGALIMIPVAIVLGVVTFGLALVPVWFASVVWAVVAVNNSNKRAFAPATRARQATSTVSAPPSRVHASTPTPETASHMPEPTPAELPNHRTAASVPGFDLARWFDGNKRSVTIAGAGVIGLLVAIVALRYVLSIDFGGRPPIREARANATAAERIPTEFQINIPKALVPITPAAAVMPKWDQAEDIQGNYPILTGLYVGALGKRTFKLVVSTADTLNKRMSGFSSTSTAQTSFEGTFTSRIEQPNSRVADNVISVQTWVFEAIIFEPRGIGGNGVFKLRFDCTDAQGRSVTGTWTSYDGRLYREIKLLDTITAANQ